MNILFNMDKRENEIVGGEPDDGSAVLIYKKEIMDDSAFWSMWADSYRIYIAVWLFIKQVAMCSSGWNLF